MDGEWNVAVASGLAGGRIVYFGLKAPSLESVERWLPVDDAGAESVPDRRTLFRQLKILEHEALQHLNA